MMKKQSGPVDSSQSGLSLVGVLFTAAIAGILTNIAAPIVSEALLKAKAETIISEFVFLRRAALAYHSENNHWPQDCAMGQEPKELAPYLNGMIHWNQNGFTYDWENWKGKNENRESPDAGIVIGFSVRTQDDRLVKTIQQLWGDYLPQLHEKGVTFVIRGI